MKSYQTTTVNKKNRLQINEGYTGERLEEKIERITVNKEPITDGAPVVYTERSEGVIADYNPRTDKWDKAIEAMGVVEKTHKTKREERIKTRKKDFKKEETKDGGAEPVNATNSNNN